MPNPLKKYIQLTMALISFQACSTPILPSPNEPTILELTDRGTVTDTPRTVPNKKILIETGYQYQDLILTNRLQGDHLQSYPQTEIVFGLPKQTEVFVLLPNYNQLSNRTSQDFISGFGATSFGVKHELLYGKNWVASVQGVLTPPGGNPTFGSPGVGSQLNAMAVYSITRKWNIGCMLGGNTITESKLLGGGRVNSISINGAMSYSITEPVILFGEIFGQTKTAIDREDGFVGNVGFLYLLTENAVLDFELAQALTGALGEYNHYVGGGITIKI